MLLASVLSSPVTSWTHDSIVFVAGMLIVSHANVVILGVTCILFLPALGTLVPTVWWFVYLNIQVTAAAATFR